MLLGGALGALAATAVLGASPALADAGKVLVFTGTAGTPNSASQDAVTAIQSLASGNGFTADATADATKINAANLAGYRAVIFVNSSGDVLNSAEETDLQSYITNGGGFVGIGETALLEQGNTWFDTLIGLTGASRTSGSEDDASKDIEFLDRVHPASKALPQVLRAHPDKYYSWTNNPTGLVHTVARVRFNTLPDGTSVTNDTIPRLTATQLGNQPQSERAVSWCRDVQQGRSFYTDLGQTSAAYGDGNLSKQLLGAIEWASGMVRGNCKATINSNYVATQVTPRNPTGTDSYIGEIDGVAIADDGRVFYAGRAVCAENQVQITGWSQPNVGLGCGTIHVYDPNTPGPDNTTSGSTTSPGNPAKIHKVAQLTVFGAKGGGSETGENSKDEQGLLGIALDPKFDSGRPYIYVQYHPYWGGEQGNQTAPTLGMGFDRNSFMAERRLSRFTFDPQTNSIVPGSEKVILHWNTQVYSCCHLGGSMSWDSAGNLYVATGDNTGNAPNANNSGYTNSDPFDTIPAPGGAVGTAGGAISFADARQTSADSAVYEGKLLRIHPMDTPGDTPGVGTTYTIPGASSPNGPQLFPADSQAVKDGLALPEVFAMGTRNLYSIDVDSKTDVVTAAWVGPDQGTDSTTWGPAKTENATIIGSAGNYGWPYCQAGNRFDYRAKQPSFDSASRSAGGVAAPLGAVAGTVGGGADGQTGAFWDCRGEVLNQSPYNRGLQYIPAPKPVNIWYGPQGGCYDYPRNSNGVAIYTNNNNTAAPAIYRRCPWLIGGSQAPMTAGIYRAPSGTYASHPAAWPKYWDGRWFLADYSSANNMRHALLMDPATETNGGQPDAVDSLYGILPASIVGGNSLIDWDFAPDGSLYVANYGGRFFGISATTALWHITYVGGDDTPGPDPKATTGQSSQVAFSIGKSGGVSYKWDFGDGTTSTDASPTHTYAQGGAQTATLTVTYADNTTASKSVQVDVPPSIQVPIGADVPNMLSLSLGGSPSFGGFLPATTKTYAASAAVTATSTDANAALTVVDPSTTAPGHLVNGSYSLPQAVQVHATDAAHPSTSFVPVTGSPTTLLSWTAPTSADAITLAFQQSVAQTDPLLGGTYSKTLTFTLSTTTP